MEDARLGARCAVSQPIRAGLRLVCAKAWRAEAKVNPHATNVRRFIECRTPRNQHRQEAYPSKHTVASYGRVPGLLTE
jgi:hypothetical protein